MSPLRHRLARVLEANVAANGRAGAGALLMVEWLAALPVVGTYFHHAAGRLHAAAGRHEQAIAHQGKALASGRSTHTAAIHGRLGEAHLQLGDLAAAEASFRKALALAPDARVEWLALVDTMSLQGRRLEGFDELLRAADAVPAGSPAMRVPLPWYLITPALATEQRVRILRRVVARHPTAAEAMVFLSLVENHLGHF
jgi:tetratricopeptide (TPR) repeat protein